MRSLGRSRILLVFDKHMAKFENAVYVFWGFDDRLILKYGRNNGMCDGASSGEELKREQWDITWNGEQREHRLIRIDRRDEESSQVVDGLG
jgi:hypothetical protein